MTDISNNIMKNKIITICYGKTNIYESRKEAKKFYLECMLSSEGAEHDRYSSIYQDLEQGFNLCVDNEFYEDLTFGNLKFIDEKRHTDLKRYIIENLTDNCRTLKYVDKDEIQKQILDSKFRIINNSIDYIIKDRNLERKLLLTKIVGWMMENLENITEINQILNIKDNLFIEDLETEEVDHAIVQGIHYIDEHIKKENREYTFKEQLGMNFILAREYGINTLIKETKEENQDEQSK